MPSGGANEVGGGRHEKAQPFRTASGEAAGHRQFPGIYFEHALECAGLEFDLAGGCAAPYAASIQDALKFARNRNSSSRREKAANYLT